MNKLVLFDIDRTLIKGLKAHRIAFCKAFKKVYGIETSIDIIKHPGMTDQQIIIDVLKKKGLNEKTIKPKLKQCVKEIINSYNKIKEKDKITILAGAPKLLKELNKNNILLGLVTGNLKPIAKGKLKKVGLYHYFKLGGFGDDHINRSTLIKIAIKRAKQNFNFKFNKNVFIFGDTPLDIKAGKQANVKTIGVATGRFSKKQLKKAGADFVLENLKNTNKILKIISPKSL